MNKYLTEGAISPKIITEAIKKQSDPNNTGGHSVFLGQVRADKIDNKTVAGIVYTAYEEMVATEIVKIENHIKEKYNDVKEIFIKHSVGMVEAGEISLLVLISGGHRIQAREANAETVDLIKKNVPVWKKETFKDGTYEWRENHI